MRVRLEKSTAVVALSEQPLARGGEAAIYAIPERPTLLAKVYHKPTPEQADKLAAMMAAPPEDPTARQDHASIAWPMERLLDADDPGRCVGFVMPRVEKARPLFDAYNPKSRLQAWPLFHYGYLLRTARNLSAAVRALHAAGYVLGDLNESNVLVNGQTLVTLVDTDSFQVRAGERLFRCGVGKPEYAAPEVQGADLASIERTPEQDAFALAVLIFQLLMQGTHPFAGRFTGDGEPAALGKRIAAGQWPYSRERRGPYEPIPTAPPFVVLQFPVRELMRQCFEDGHAMPSARPSAADWQKTLAQTDAEMMECVVNNQHRFHKSLDACPWCDLALKQKRDPFPPKGKPQNGPDKPAKSPRVAIAVSPAASRPAPPAAARTQLLEAIPVGRPNGRRRPPVAPPSFLATPWPWVIGAGAAVLLLLIGVAVGVAVMLLRPSRPAPVAYYSSKTSLPQRMEEEPFRAGPVGAGPGADGPAAGPGGLVPAGGEPMHGGPPGMMGGPRPGGPGAALARTPEVLQPDESRVAVVRFQAPALVFTKDLRFVLTLTGAAGPMGLPGAPMGRGRGRGLMGPPGLAGPPGGPRGAFPADGMDGMAWRRFLKPPCPRGLVDKNKPNPDPDPGDFDLEWAPLDKLQNFGITPAEQAYPVRAAEIVAAFPFRKQVEEFRAKLGFASGLDVLDDGALNPGGAAPTFAFLGVTVQRREIQRDGSPVGPGDGWTEIKPEDAYRSLLALTADDIAEDPGDLGAVAFPALAMKKVETFGARRSPPVDEYPPVEKELDHLAATLDALERGDAGAGIARPLDLLDPAFPAGPGAPAGPGFGPAPPRGFAPGGAAAQPAVPEYCLIRIFDITIEPGKTYEYRLRVRMANPTFGRPGADAQADTLSRELTSKGWCVLPGRATVAPDLSVYALDPKEAGPRDAGGGKYLTPPQPLRMGQAPLQIHRWLDYAPLPGRGDVPVGDWVIAERVGVWRGEPIPRARAAVPYWRMAQASFRLAADAKPKPGGPAAKALPTVETAFAPAGEAPILVDFTGGDIVYQRSGPTGEPGAAPAGQPAPVRDTEPSEVLLVTADGVLHARSAAEDAADPERDARLKAYRDWVQQVDAMISPKAQDNPFGPFDK